MLRTAWAVPSERPRKLSKSKGVWRTCPASRWRGRRRVGHKGLDAVTSTETDASGGRKAPKTMLRLAEPADTPALVALGVATGLFQPEEADLLLRSVLDDIHANRLGEGHLAYVWADAPAGPPAGWVYFSPEAKADGVWELWWIGVDPTRQGRGIGDELLGFVEERVREAGGRLLLISTSSLPPLERTRRFYAKRGYAECGRIPDYYADGDDKVIFAKRVASPALRVR